MPARYLDEPFTGTRLHPQLRYLIEASSDGSRWEQLRMAHLHEGRGRPVVCGLYACSPKGPGFIAEFDQLTIDSADGPRP
jgi:regulation of enolase protein 1 (concanavalin A-like superfamily)